MTRKRLEEIRARVAKAAGDELTMEGPGPFRIADFYRNSPADLAWLLSRVEALGEALRCFEVWADGYVNKRTGMGAGMHKEMWPNLTPSAARRMLDDSRRALAETFGDETP